MLHWLHNALKIKLKYIQKLFQYYRYKKINNLSMPDHLAALCLFTRNLICNFNQNVPNVDILCKERVLTLIIVYWSERFIYKPMFPQNIVLNCGIIYGNTTPRSNIPFNIWMDLKFIVKQFSIFTVRHSATKSGINIKYAAIYKDNLRRVMGVWKLKIKALTSPRTRLVPREIQSYPVKAYLPADGPVSQPTDLPRYSRWFLFITQKSHCILIYFD